MSLSVKTFAELGEAAGALSMERGARYLGGGTIVMRDVNAGSRSISTIIRATDPALRLIRVEGERVTIGAGVTMAQVAASRDLVFLAAPARVIGGPGVRAMATVGGNLFVAAPYGDFATALLVLDATVTLAGGVSGRSMPLEELLRDRERHQRTLVASVTVARPGHDAFRFIKVGRVKPKGASILTMAANLPQAGRRVTNARIAYGAMGPVPQRVPAVERALEGRTLDEAGVAPAVAAALDGVDPPDDALASGWYRREVAPVHLKRLLLGGTR